MQEYRGITLRPVVNSDLPMLFTLLSNPDRFHLWGQRRACDESQFYEMWRCWSADRLGAKFIVLRRRAPIGLVFDYERSTEDGHTKIASILFDEASGRGAGVIATALFGLWLFDNVPLRKVYVEVFGFNAPVIRMLGKLQVRAEMRRAQHRFWNGKYWDQYGFAIYREEMAGLCKRLFRRGRIRHVSLPFAARELPVRLRRDGNAAAPPARNDYATDDVIESLFAPGR